MRLAGKVPANLHVTDTAVAGLVELEDFALTRMCGGHGRNETDSITGRNKTGVDALMGASFKGLAPIAEMLIGATALIVAALSGKEPVVKLLLAGGADPALADHRGITAALLARQQGNDVLAEMLEKWAAKR